jgi:DNA-binding response OmpR family regulator
LRFFSKVSDFLGAVLEKEEVTLPAAAILDLGLSDGTLTAAIQGPSSKSLLSFFSGVPCMVVSGCDDTEVLRLCFRSGIRDYLVKPFAVNELLVKSERMIAESHIRDAEAQMKGLLTPRERTILEILFEAQDHSPGFAEKGVPGVSKKEILNRVWPNVVVTPGAVDVHLSHLRRKLESTQWEIRWVGHERWSLVRKSDSGTVD